MDGQLLLAILVRFNTSTTIASWEGESKATLPRHESSCGFEFCRIWKKWRIFIELPTRPLDPAIEQTQNRFIGAKDDDLREQKHKKWVCFLNWYRYIDFFVEDCCSICPSFELPQGIPYYSKLPISIRVATFGVTRGGLTDKSLFEPI